MKICKILFLLKQQRFDIQYMKTKNKSRNAVMWFPKTGAIFVSLYFVLCCAFVYPAATQASCWTRSQSIIPTCLRQWAVAISFMQANNQNPQWAKKATFTHLTEPPTSQIFYPLSLSKKLLSQHICSHLALNIHRETVKSLFRVINMRGRGKKTFPKKKKNGCRPKGICLHLSKVSHSVLLCSVVWLRKQQVGSVLTSQSAKVSRFRGSGTPERDLISFVL